MGATQLSQVRVGIVDSHDPEDVTLGSGWSSALTAALCEVVGDVVPINAQPPRLVHRLLYLASVATRLRSSDLCDVRAGAHRVSNSAFLGRPLTASRHLAASARLRAAGSLHGVVQRGCDMLVSNPAPLVTFEDSTLLQAVRSYPWPHLQGLSEQELERYAARQRHIYRRARAACVSSHWAADSVVGDYGMQPSRVRVVGLGKNHELQPVPRDWQTPRFLFVGVAWERKNGPAVLRAFARVRERWPQARLDVVGGHPRLDAPGVTGHGRLSLGEPDERARLESLFAQATVFVMPSLHEPTGTVYAEAAGAGIASIGTTDGGAATVVGPGGRLVDPRAFEQIAAAMLELAEPATAARLGAIAQEHSRLFTWRKVAERLLGAMAIPGLDGAHLAAPL
jgi:glycosyltransferase involved in cell wall biosynthesis